ncbi:MAG: HAMP domain-containing protein [Chloroflexi bacterium]|nr:HAMP domain-containing protein [Chloroflexota bacterium]
MIHTLRTRLLISYVTILLVTLGLIGLALLVFLRSRPLPTDEISNDLVVSLLDIRVQEFGRGPQRQQGQPVETLTIEFLAAEADTHDVRVLVVGSQGEMYFDSSGVFPEGIVLPGVAFEALAPPMRGRASLLFEGRFENPDGGEWIYIAQALRPFQQMMNSDLESPVLLVAAPAPHPSLRQVFRQFGSTFFTPLARAGALGLLIALTLSALIARSVARPLQHMSQAARRLAEGDFRQRVPVAGPHEVRSLAQSFNEMAARVAHTQQAQRDFLANVSHDLRTPLTSIQGFAQAIAEEVAAEPEARQHAAQIIHDEAARMHRMVESLLELARLEAGQLDLLRQSVQIGDLLAALAESLTIKARDQGVQLSLDVPPDLPRITGDGDRLAQVFANLIDNAIRHTPPGGQVTVRARADSTGLTTTVRDTGEGIPAEDLPRIFERFYQVDKSRQRDHRAGIGLGLAIARQVIEAHGGTIQTASTPGTGTTFTVWLPLPAPDSAARERP